MWKDDNVYTSRQLKHDGQKCEQVSRRKTIPLCSNG